MTSEPRPSPSPLARRELGVLAGIAAFAFVLRLAFVLGQRHDVLFDYPAMDEERYVAAARTMAAGQPAEAIPWFQPPGLVYALAIVFRIMGQGLTAPRVVQAAVSSAACVLTFAIARRFFSHRLALAASVVCALHGVMVFESYELLPPTWVMTADLVALWMLLRATERRTAWRALAAGIALGASAVFSPIILPFVLVAAAALRRAPLVVAFVAGVALPIAPVAVDNWQRGHELVAISTNGGINFYLGNNPDYDTTLALRPGRHWQELTDEPTRVVGARTPGERSAYFMKKGLSFYVHEPGRALSLYVRKLYLYFNGVQLPRDTDVYAERGSSRLLSVLVARGPPNVPDGVILPLALVGIVASLRRDPRRFLVPVGFLALQAACVAAFFVTSRYRLPAMPVFATFGCAGAVAVRDSWRCDRGLERALPTAALAVLLVVLNLPVREARASYAAERDFYRGVAQLFNRHDPVAAIEPLRRAAVADPGDARIWFELGNALDGARRSDQAIEAWRRAAAADPEDPRAAHRAVSALLAKGDLDGAIATIQADIDAHGRPAASYAPDHLNLALLRATRGDGAGAALELQRAEAADPAYFSGSIAPWTKAALANVQLADAALWLSIGDAVSDVDRGLALHAWRRAEASHPSDAQQAALLQRLGP